MGPTGAGAPCPVHTHDKARLLASLLCPPGPWALRLALATLPAVLSLAEVPAASWRLGHAGHLRRQNQESCPLLGILGGSFPETRRAGWYLLALGNND